MAAARAVAASMFCGILLLFAVKAFAVEPGEMLKDPALEHRARALSAELRCLVCQNESIDNSNADLAHDLRVLVRQRLTTGDTDRQVLDFIVARYGEFVLLKPRFDLRNAALWATPVIVLLIGGVLGYSTMRGRSGRRMAALTRDEEAKLKSLLEKSS